MSATLRHQPDTERQRKPVTASFYDIDEIDDYVADPFQDDQDEYREWVEATGKEDGPDLDVEALALMAGHYETQRMMERGIATW